MTIEVEKSDITRIGHTCHSKDGFLEIFCEPDTDNRKPPVKHVLEF